MSSPCLQGGSVLQLVERRHGLSRVMLVGKYSVAWLKKAVEKMVRLEEDFAFIKSSREGNRAFIAQKGSNKASRFMEVVEYTMGGHLGLIIVLEGHEEQRWKILADELGKVMAMFDSSPGKVHGVHSKLHLPSSKGKELEVPPVTMVVQRVPQVLTIMGPSWKFVVLHLQRWCTWQSLTQH